MEILSDSFRNEEMMPSRLTCDGYNYSPHFKWINIPPNTKSFTLIFDDPDAPAGTWVHWIIINIPASVRELAENGILPVGSIECTNSWNQTGYGGPCPPLGTHRYYVRIYALDGMLGLGKEARKSEVARAMQGHILEEAVIFGRYARVK